MRAQRTLYAKGAWKNEKFKGYEIGRLAKQLCCTTCSHHASFNFVSVCFGALRGCPLSTMALIGNARQATSERKIGPVETRLSGLVLTALHNIEILQSD